MFASTMLEKIKKKTYSTAVDMKLSEVYCYVVAEETG
jgi:hypothetical protein